MDRQLSRQSQFKDSTRAFLSRAQKLEIADAAYRAYDHLLSLCEPSNSSFNRKSFRQRTDNVFRAGSLIKGKLQRRHLCRRERQIEIWSHAFEIAEETGESVVEIYDYLMPFMHPYVSEDPY